MTIPNVAARVFSADLETPAIGFALASLLRAAYDTTVASVVRWGQLFYPSGASVGFQATQAGHAYPNIVSVDTGNILIIGVAGWTSPNQVLGYLSQNTTVNVGASYTIPRWLLDVANDIPAAYSTKILNTLASPSKRVVFCGHQVGGALAKVIAYSLVAATPSLAERVAVVTFGAPKPFANVNPLLRILGQTGWFCSSPDKTSYDTAPFLPNSRATLYAQNNRATESQPGGVVSSNLRWNDPGSHFLIGTDGSREALGTSFFDYGSSAFGVAGFQAPGLPFTDAGAFWPESFIESYINGYLAWSRGGDIYNAVLAHKAYMNSQGINSLAAATPVALGTITPMTINNPQPFRQPGNVPVNVARPFQPVVCNYGSAVGGSFDAARTGNLFKGHDRNILTTLLDVIAGIYKRDELTTREYTDSGTLVLKRSISNRIKIFDESDPAISEAADLLALRAADLLAMKKD